MSPLPGDTPNVMVFEAHNYGNYNNISLGNFNIDWNNFAMIMDVDCKMIFINLQQIHLQIFTEVCNICCFHFIGLMLASLED